MGSRIKISFLCLFPILNKLTYIQAQGKQYFSRMTDLLQHPSRGTTQREVPASSGAGEKEQSGQPSNQLSWDRSPSVQQTSSSFLFHVYIILTYPFLFQMCTTNGSICLQRARMGRALGRSYNSTWRRRAAQSGWTSAPAVVLQGLARRREAVPARYRSFSLHSLYGTIYLSKAVLE